MIVVDDRGFLVADSDGPVPPKALYATSGRPEIQRAMEGTPFSQIRDSIDLGHDIMATAVPIQDEEQLLGAVRLTRSVQQVNDDIRNITIGLGAIGLAALAAGLLLAFWLAGSLSRPLTRLAGAAKRLGHGDLSARAGDVSGAREVEELGQSFDEMADRLERSVQAQREFVANASHQLRTPLTGIKLRLEAIRAEGGVAGDNAEKAEQELDRLEALVDDLLALAAAATPPPSGVTVDLCSVAEDAVERWQAPAGEAEKTVGAGRLEQALVFADPADLAHVVDNLIENALRYTPPGAEVTVESAFENGQGALVVADNGPGIPEDDRARVFERFYRGSNGRRLGPGTGLGLAIVAELVERWDGQVTLADGPGTRVRVVFRQMPADL